MKCKMLKCRITIAGHKIWRDGNNLTKVRPPFVKINLLRDKEVYKSVEIDSTGDGAYIFDCLPVYKNSSHKYVYQIDETEVPTGYTKTIDGYNVINTINPGLITINGTKIWDDNNNEGNKRPLNITVSLFQNGTQIDTVQVITPPNADDEVDFSFNNLAQFDSKGSPYIYTVNENEVPEYKKTIDDYYITNSILAP